MIDAAQFSDEAHTTIRAVMDGVTVLVPADPGNRHYQEIQAWVEQGNEITPYTPPPPIIPQSVTPRQARLAIDSAGLTAQVEAAVTAAGAAAKITWDYALEIKRDDPLLDQLAQALKLTSDQLDQLFITAAGL